MQDHSHHSEKTKNNLINRLKKIEGQIRGIARMINEDVYCDNIFAQISSVEAALNGVKRLLLDAHIRECIVEQIRENKNDDVVDELMTTIKRIVK
ncbi:MAG: metal-sensitive transcriptional regulator [Spirochaetales bacterium]|nr:metal-sensitive transcriptional regulator [Spirochaetales bacterium]